jgi:hypothetical protein
MSLSAEWPVRCARVRASAGVGSAVVVHVRPVLVHGVLVSAGLYAVWALEASTSSAWTMGAKAGGVEVTATRQQAVAALGAAFT